MVICIAVLLATLSLVAGDPSRTAGDLERLAAELCRKGRCQEGERLQLQALRLWTEAARTHPVDLAAPNANLAQIYIAEGKLSAAERHLLLAIQLQDQSKAPPLDRAQVASLLAKVRFQQGRYAEAAEQQAGVVQTLEGPAIADRGVLAVAMNDLAMIKAASGDLRVARDLLERAVEIHRRTGNPSGGGFGEVLGNLALVCVRQGDYRAAEPLYREAISNVEVALGPAHPHLGMLLAEYAKVLKKTGQKPVAKQAEVRAKAILGSATELAGRNTVDASAPQRPLP